MVHVFSPSAEAVLKSGDPAPEFEAVSLNGDSFTLTGLRGKVVLLYFWASWSNLSNRELPNTKVVYGKYHGDGFAVIGISLDYDRQALSGFLEAERLPWPQIYDNDQRVSLAESYGIEFVPTLLLIDREGVVRDAEARGDRLEDGVVRLLHVSKRRYAPNAMFATSPEAPQSGDTVTVTYRPESTEHREAGQVFMTWGVNWWSTPPPALWEGTRTTVGDDGLAQTPMSREGEAWVGSFRTDEAVSSIDIRFRDNYGRELDRYFEVALPGDAQLRNRYRAAYLLFDQGKYERLIEALQPLAGNPAIDRRLLAAVLSDLVVAYDSLNRTEQKQAALARLDSLGLIGEGWQNKFVWQLVTRRTVRPGHLAAGEILIRNLCEAVPGRPAFLDTYAWTLYHLGRYSEAVELQAKALETPPASGDFYFRYGAMLARLGKLKEAREAMAKGQDVGGRDSKYYFFQELAEQALAEAYEKR